MARVLLLFRPKKAIRWNRNPRAAFIRGHAAFIRGHQEGNGMARKRKAAKRTIGPTCSICSGAMMLRGTIPPAHIFPELRTYQCSECGHLRTVEDEAEFAAFEVRQAA
jgi:hypothetical protein